MRGMPVSEPQRVLPLDRCPHCSVASPLMVQMWLGQGQTSRSVYTRQWAVFMCTNCGGAVLAASDIGINLSMHDPYAVYPSPPTAHKDLPEVARTYLDQAYRTLDAPDAAAVMAGSAVDAMLKALGYETGSVYARIDKALQDNKLTDGMAQWAHAVRLEANRPRHADAANPHVSAAEARQAVDFAEALGNFLFVLTARIKRGIQEAEASS